MVIEEKDFRIISNDSSAVYDLELLYVVNKGKANERVEFRNEAYGISFEHALKRIIQYRINSKYETLSLKEFLEVYKQEVKSIKNLINLNDENK